jgi:hypothetical protein
VAKYSKFDTAEEAELAFAKAVLSYKVIREL